MTPLRADAQRNLGRVLDAAVEVFAEQGPDASVDEIARRAGVGHATVFRRFPTKDALVAAVGEARIERLRELAEAALADEDAGRGFESFVWRVAEEHVACRGLYECVGRCLASEPGRELQAAVARIVERAQAAGVVRADVSPGDVPALVGAAIRSAPPERWRSYVAVVVDGLKA